MPPINEKWLLKKTELAGFLGLTTETISQWGRRGCPVHQKGRKGARTLFYLPSVWKWRESDLERQYANRPGLADRNAARRKLEHFKAEAAELNFHEQCGQLVRVSDVEKEGFRIGRIVRDSILAVPDRLAGLLAAEGDQFTCHAMLMKELTRALEELPKKHVERLTVAQDSEPRVNGQPR